jgi:transposase-like protein
MKPQNKYSRRSNISEGKFREIIKYFAEDLTAKQIAKFTKINRNTINRYLTGIREKIAEYCEQESVLKGTVEIDESYFGPKRVRGKRGRGAGKKIPVFGLLKRNGKVYTKIVPNVTRAILTRIIKAKVKNGSIIHSDRFKSYDGLVDLGYRKHYRVNHGKNEFANEKSHINGIENFWGLAKVRLVKFRGIHERNFYLHLKECEFRFNYRNENLYDKILSIIKEKPLF